MSGMPIEAHPHRTGEIMMQDRLRRLVAKPAFEATIIVLIVVNAIILAMETSSEIMATWGPLLIAADTVILGIFVVEIVLRFLADPRGFLARPLAHLRPDGHQPSRSCRPPGRSRSCAPSAILRILRLVAAVPAMRRVVTGLLQALPGMGSIVMLLGLIFFVFSVISTTLRARPSPTVRHARRLGLTLLMSA